MPTIFPIFPIAKDEYRFDAFRANTSLCWRATRDSSAASEGGGSPALRVWLIVGLGVSAASRGDTGRSVNDQRLASGETAGIWMCDGGVTRRGWMAGGGGVGNRGREVGGSNGSSSGRVVRRGVGDRRRSSAADALAYRSARPSPFGPVVEEEETVRAVVEGPGPA